MALGAGGAAAEPGLPSAGDWRAHVTDDLLPFWSAPGAAGTPEGAFPGRLCNDGSVPVPGVACAGVRANQTDGQRTLVGQSRQVFSYAVAFHMTGNTRWLDLARAGVEDQFDTFYDADQNRFAERYNPINGNLRGLEEPNAQKQAYGLLGPGMLYYLTGDPVLYGRIRSVADGIEQDFRRGDGFAMGLGDTAPSTRLVDTLDQLNAWQTLLAAQAPLADRPALIDRAHRTARDLVARFHDPVTGLFKTDAEQPDGSLANVSYGHSIKALWFIDQTAQLAGDAALARFAAQGAGPVLARAFAPGGGWRAGTDATGAPLPEGSWWEHAELTQYAAALAITRPELREMLTQAQRFWLDNYVDAASGGVWARVALPGGAPATERPKHWEWKAGFHSYEHALISYLAASAMEDGTATLFFARQDGTLPDTLAYGFGGSPSLVPGVASPFAAAPEPVQQVQVSGLTYRDAATTVVPLPPAGLALLAGLGWLTLRGRKVRAMA